jgi:hypothetical protein
MDNIQCMGISYYNIKTNDKLVPMFHLTNFLKQIILRKLIVTQHVNKSQAFLIT